MTTINIIMIHNGFLNKIYNQKEKKSARTKKSLVTCSKKTKRLSTRYIIIAVTMWSKIQPSFRADSDTFAMRHEETGGTWNSTCHRGFPRRSDGSIASSGQFPEIPSLLRRPGTMQGPLFSASSCPSENNLQRNRTMLIKLWLFLIIIIR